MRPIDLPDFHEDDDDGFITPQEREITRAAAQASQARGRAQIEVITASITIIPPADED